MNEVVINEARIYSYAGSVFEAFSALTQAHIYQIMNALAGSKKVRGYCYAYCDELLSKIVMLSLEAYLLSDNVAN